MQDRRRWTQSCPSMFELLTAEEVEDVHPKSKGAVVVCRCGDGNLGSAQRMRPKEARVRPDAGDPIGDQPGVLPRRYRPISTATAVEEEFARAFISACEIIFDLLSRMETHPSSRVEHEMGEP